MVFETSQAPRPHRAPDAAPDIEEAQQRPSDHSGDRSGPVRRPPLRAHYAAIDLGTNNCRLLIARPAAQGFTVIDAFSRIVRLGEGLTASGRLSDDAIDRAVSALAICAGKLRRRNVVLARSVATEACRRAANGDEFAQRVYAETGIKLDIISPREEARLAVLGSHSLLEPGHGPALIFDIGGGSTELVLVDTGGGGEPRILDWHSAPWGVVSLSEWIGDMAHGDDDTRREAYRRMRAQVSDAFRGFAERMPSGQPCRLLGTSGTVTTLASVLLGLPRYDRATIDGLVVPTETMRSIAAHIACLNLDDRAALPCIGPERADLVVAGCAILEAILDIWPAERLSVADRGIREGILRSLMHDSTALDAWRQADA